MWANLVLGYLPNSNMVKLWKFSQPPHFTWDYWELGNNVNIFVLATWRNFHELGKFVEIWPHLLILNFSKVLLGNFVWFFLSLLFGKFPKILPCLIGMTRIPKYPYSFIPISIPICFLIYSYLTDFFPICMQTNRGSDVC